MERRDYLEKEIEKMQAVLQKIFRMRVDKEEDALELIATELVRYFNISLSELQLMTMDEFQYFVQNKNISLLNYLGQLLYASANLQTPLNTTDRLSLQKTLLAWKIWESKTKTLDLEQLETKNRIIALLNKEID